MFIYLTSILWKSCISHGFLYFIMQHTVYVFFWTSFYRYLTAVLFRRTFSPRRELVVSGSVWVRFTQYPYVSILFTAHLIGVKSFVIFESREPIRRSDCGATPDLKRNHEKRMDFRFWKRCTYM